jgi:hypothetical protein
MNIPIIHTSAEKPEGEQLAGTCDGSDLAFLQLLAGLRLTQPIPVESGPCLAPNSGTFAQTESPCVDQSVFPLTGVVNTLQEETVADGKARIEMTQAGAKMQELLAHAIISAGNDERGSIEIDVGQAVAIGVNNVTVQDQAATEQGKLVLPATERLDIKPAAENVPQASTPKDEMQAAPARLMDVPFSGHAPKEYGTSAVTPASIALAPNVGIPSPLNPDTPVKQMAATASSLISNIVMESSDPPQSGTDNNSASAEHESGKERFISAETHGTQSAASSVASSLNSQASPAPSRAVAPAVVEAPTTRILAELPLPASVRFEVQPGDMGRIRVHLSVVDHTVYTNVMTERVDAQEFLVRSADRFEAGLAAHGLDVGRFQVDVQGQGRQHADRGGPWSQDDLHRRHPLSSDQSMLEEEPGDREPNRMHRMINVFA